MDETIKLMCHNIIGQTKRIFLESWFTSCQKQVILILMTQKNVALYYYVKVLFKHVPINMS
jgi:hypothetical protein